MLKEKLVMMVMMDRTAFPVYLELKEPQETGDLRDHKGLQEIRVMLEIMEPMEHQVLPEMMELKAQQEKREPREKRE